MSDQNSTLDQEIVGIKTQIDGIGPNRQDFVQEHEQVRGLLEKLFQMLPLGQEHIYIDGPGYVSFYLRYSPIGGERIEFDELAGEYFGRPKEGKLDDDSLETILKQVTFNKNLRAGLRDKTSYILTQFWPDIAEQYASISTELILQCFWERDLSVIKSVKDNQEGNKRKAIDKIVNTFEGQIKDVFEFINDMPSWLEGIQAEDGKQYLEYVHEISKLNYRAGIGFGQIAASIKDKDIIKEYAKGVQFLLKKSTTEKELQIEGLLAAILDPKNIELIKKSFTNPIFRYILYQTTRKLPIDDPSLWVYGSDAESEERCAKAQLDAIGYKHFELEKNLIRKKMSKVLKRVGSKKGKDFYYIDIGVGNGEKTLEAIKSARNHGLTVNCGLVEPNHEMLGIAKRTIEDNLNSVNIHEFPDKIEDLKKQEDFKNFRSGKPALFSFFGTTFCNFNPDDITQALYEVMEPGDYILIGVYLYQEGKKGIDEKINTAYRTDAVKDFSAQPLLNLGVTQEDLENRFKYSMRLHREEDYELSSLVTRVLTSFTYTGEEPLEVGLVTFREGDEVPGILSIKYTDEQMREILKRNKLTQVDTFREGDVALYLAKKE